MKKVLLTTFVALMTVICFSCSKEKELAGTSWQYHESTSDVIEEEGMSIPYTADITLKINFNDDSHGELIYDISMSVMGFNQDIDDKSNFSYTFDGTNGVMTDEDGSDPINFEYNKNDNTITLRAPAEAVDEIELGTNGEIVFEEVK